VLCADWVANAISQTGTAARHYTGITGDLERRLTDHNRGNDIATAKHRPWRTIAAIRLPDIAKARAFEHYLKSGSGRAFAKRHF